MAAIPHVKCDVGSGRENTNIYINLLVIQFSINGFISLFEMD